jgi:uncharacterized protein (DUF302 family)
MAMTIGALSKRAGVPVKTLRAYEDMGLIYTVGRGPRRLRSRALGVLTEIDVRATLREKLGTEMEDYLILGACNAPLAHRALDIDRRRAHGRPSRAR